MPVPVTIFSPIATGGMPQQPITSFKYKNMGVNIDITPRVHHDDEVTLKLKVDISSQGPAGYQGLPTFNSRTVTSVIRLSDGETSILAGLINDQERDEHDGHARARQRPRSRAPLRPEHDRGHDQTDIVMTLTPHVVRRPAITEEDLRSFEIGNEGSSVVIDAPTVPPFQAPPRPRAVPRAAAGRADPPAGPADSDAADLRSLRIATGAARSGPRPSSAPDGPPAPALSARQISGPPSSRGYEHARRRWPPARCR